LRAGAYELVAGGSGGQDLGAGDLYITVICDGVAYADRMDSSVSLRMTLYIENQEVAAQWFSGTGVVRGSVAAAVRAATGDRRIECIAQGPFSQGSRTGTLLGSGPLNANLLLDAFIPYEWIKEPFDPGDPWDEEVSEGDNRGFGFGGTSRITIGLDLLNPAVSNNVMIGSGVYEVGMSVEYDAETSLSDYPNLGDLAPQGGYLLNDARADWTWGIDKKMRWGYASTDFLRCDPPERLGPNAYEATSSMRVYCEATAYYPYHSLAPGIDFEYTITLTFGRNQIAWIVEGCRDSFPAYEAHLNGQKLLHHGDDGSPSSLFPPCDVTVYEQGVIR